MLCRYLYQQIKKKEFLKKTTLQQRCPGIQSNPNPIHPLIANANTNKIQTKVQIQIQIQTQILTKILTQIQTQLKLQIQIQIQIQIKTQIQIQSTCEQAPWATAAPRRRVAVTILIYMMMMND